MKSGMCSPKMGNMAEAGAVSWMFSKKGYIVIEEGKADEDTVMALAIEAGADDFAHESAHYEIYTSPNAFDGVLTALKDKGNRYPVR